MVRNNKGGRNTKRWGVSSPVEKAAIQVILGRFVSRRAEEMALV